MVASDGSPFHCQRCRRTSAAIASCALPNCEFRHHHDSPQPSGFAGLVWLSVLTAALILTVVLAFLNTPFSLPVLVLVPILLVLMAHAAILRWFARQGEWLTLERSKSGSVLRLGMLNGYVVTSTHIQLIEELRVPARPPTEVPVSEALVAPVNYVRLLSFGRLAHHRAHPEVDFHHTRAERMVVATLADLAAHGYLHIYRARITYKDSFAHLLHHLTFALLRRPRRWDDYVILATHNPKVLTSLPVGELEQRLLRIVRTWNATLRSGPENALPNVFRATHMLFPEPVVWPNAELVDWADSGTSSRLSQRRAHFQAGKAWYERLSQDESQFVAHAELQVRRALEGRTESV